MWPNAHDGWQKRIINIWRTSLLLLLLLLLLLRCWSISDELTMHTHIYTPSAQFIALFRLNACRTQFCVHLKREKETHKCEQLKTIFYFRIRPKITFLLYIIYLSIYIQFKSVFVCRVSTLHYLSVWDRTNNRTNKRNNEKNWIK